MRNGPFAGDSATILRLFSNKMHVFFGFCVDKMKFGSFFPLIYDLVFMAPHICNLKVEMYIGQWSSYVFVTVYYIQTMQKNRESILSATQKNYKRKVFECTACDWLIAANANHIEELLK